MMYHEYGMGAGWSLILFAVLLPALLLAAGLLVAQFQRTPHAPEPDAERVLAELLGCTLIGVLPGLALRLLRHGRA
jgi:hypothetical protein